MKRFVKVSQLIKAISKDGVCFAFRNSDEVFLKRKDATGKKNWKLKKDGLYVKRQYAESYGLLSGDSPHDRLMKSLGVSIAQPGA